MRLTMHKLILSFLVVFATVLSFSFGKFSGLTTSSSHFAVVELLEVPGSS